MGGMLEKEMTGVEDSVFDVDGASDMFDDIWGDDEGLKVGRGGVVVGFRLGEAGADEREGHVVRAQSGGAGDLPEGDLDGLLRRRPIHAVHRRRRDHGSPGALLGSPS